ncbi:MAG: ribonuclease [Acidobacteriota bacterium]|nr:ribonuclease [Acidobacteriota bacterium]MDT5261028.1 ribonuclease [Acidobacteriota bacterium]MDT7779924.1 ribonuclease [Acidobacteriota bacterium]
MERFVNKVSNVIEIIPLGGVGEFGSNCMAVRYGEDMILVDVGMGFPAESAYGVDVEVPDFDFLEEYRENILAVVITHGHEDHIGALPYVLKKFNVPVYASHFTMGLIESKLDEHDLLSDVLLHRVEPRDRVQIGEFLVEFIRVSHSLIDCFALAINTPIGTIIHTGDYKVDETPVIGEPIDLRTLRRYGQEGVLALTSDSTNATVPGRTPSERAVIPDFEEIFSEAEGRIFVAAFASSIHRLQIVIDVAQQFDRKVCVLGRSMVKNVEIAERLGYLDLHEGMLVSLQQAKKLHDDEIVYLITGSQGEPRAALSQLSSQTYKGLTISEGDTVILSARIIPGNERSISKLIGQIYKRGAAIIDEKRRLIHVSGHASQEDIRIMTEAVRPKFVVPVHGEYRMLYRHKEFLKNHCDFPADNIILIENGDVLVLDADHASVVEKREVGRTFIGESRFDEIDGEVIRERRQLAFDGVVTPVITIDEESGELEGEPEVVTRGVNGLDGNGNSAAFLREMESLVAKTVNAATRDERRDSTVLKERVRQELKRFIQKQTGTRPVIMPVVVQI